MDIKGYTIANLEKWDRAINGTVGAEGKLVGGVGENASDEEKIAEYDRLGGLILKGKRKVKMGSFYDFEKKQPRKKPNVILVLRDLEGEVQEFSEEEEIPAEVRAAEAIQEKKDAKARAKQDAIDAKKAGKTAKDKKDEDDDEEDNEDE